MDYSLGEFVATQICNFSDEGYKNFLDITRSNRKLDELLNKRRGILKKNLPSEELDKRLGLNQKRVDLARDKVRASLRDLMSEDQLSDIKKYKEYTLSLKEVGKGSPGTVSLVKAYRS